MNQFFTLASFVLVVLTSFAQASTPTWVKPAWDSATQSQLAQGQVVLFTPPKTPSSGAQLAGAIHLQASPEEVWNVITNPSGMPEYLNNLKEARLLKSAPSYQLISHTVKHPILSKTLTYRYRADHVLHRQVRFKMLEGDLRNFEGSWQLLDGAELGQKGGTVVFYQLYVDPGGMIPRRVLERRQRRDLPNMLQLMRNRVYSLRNA